MTTNSTSGSTISSVHQNVNPSEVGWQFVPQYYSFVNKQPNRLHCFYTKASTFIHGTEGEDGRHYHGQQEIHNKILSIGFQDCKVFIHSVDAQASAAGGIIIQVIGEMSNRGEPWKKFVQTFFLAEQPNGYFVLNDIFRFLKEESVEDDEAISESPEAQSAPQESIQPAQDQHVPEPVHHEPAAPAPPVNLPTPAPVPVVEHREPTPAPVAEPEPEPEPVPAVEPVKQPNGVHHAPEPEQAVEPVVEVPAPVDTAPESELTPAPIESVPAPAISPSPAPAPAPVPAASAPSPPAQASTPVPTQQQPPPKAQPQVKSWATMAASNKNKWGSAVAQDRTGMSIEVATASPPASGAQTPVHAHGATTPNRQHGQQGQQHGPNKSQQQHTTAAQITAPQVFVKGVVDPITDDSLKSELSKFGTIKYFDVVRSKACAFVEYTSIDAAKRAITVSAEKGGVMIDCGPDHEKLRVSVEIRKERGDRPPPRQHTHARGGQPNQSGGGNDRGNFRGRGRGRGAPPAGGVKA